MICTCQTCKRPFWRFRRDYPPRGVCSLPCFHDRRIDYDENPPDLPRDSILIWPNCESCEELQTEYAESLNFHYDRVTKGKCS
jgi:hypothetical protein